ncbi:response regulator [Patescibacteria group bacterium]|nr:response regulator [Patescibacteria group bacterium]
MNSSKFLIADDSDAKIMMLEGIIKKAQFPAEILIAKTTEEADKLISENTDIAFAFVDYEIPSALGPAIITHLKEVNPKAHIALVSSSNSEKYQNNAAEAGAEKYICTSFESDDVEHRLLELLKEWEAAY